MAGARHKQDARLQAEAEAKALEQAKQAEKAAKRREKEARKAAAARKPDIQKSDAPQSVKAQGRTAIPAVPSAEPASGKSREQRLAELLELYKKDAITTEEYHRTRARILAEP